MVLSDILANMAAMPELADFTLICKDKQWRVHSLLILSWSKTLGQPRHDDAENPNVSKHDLSRFEPEHVEALKNFLYGAEDQIAEADTPREEMCLNINLCIIAHEYGISNLTDFASDKFGLALSDAEAGDLAQVIELAYANETATTTIRKDIVDELIGRKRFHAEGQDCHALDATMKAYPQSANDIFHAQNAWYKEEIQKMARKHKLEVEKHKKVQAPLFRCPKWPNCLNVFQCTMLDDYREHKCPNKSFEHKETGKVWKARYLVKEVNVRYA